MFRSGYERRYKYDVIDRIRKDCADCERIGIPLTSVLPELNANVSRNPNDIDNERLISEMRSCLSMSLE